MLKMCWEVITIQQLVEGLKSPVTVGFSIFSMFICWWTITSSSLKSLSFEGLEVTVDMRNLTDDFCDKCIGGRKSGKKKKSCRFWDNLEYVVWVLQIVLSAIILIRFVWNSSTAIAAYSFRYNWLRFF